MKILSFSSPARIKSLKYALQGLLFMVLHEPNARIHLLATAIVILSGICLHIDRLEWLLIGLCTGFVLSLEAMNTAIERLCDVVQPEWHPAIKKIKDVSAAAVLVASISAAVTGTFIFLPKIIDICLP